MVSAAEMKSLVEEIVALGNVLRVYHGHVKDLAVTRPKASPADLAAVRGITPHLPPSFLQLLSICDGVDNFDWVDISLLSSDYLLNQPDPTGPWIEGAAFSKGERVIIGQSDTDPHAIAFLTETVAEDGEMEVMDFDNDGPIETYPHLEAYLRARRDWFANAVSEEKADREGIADDE